MLSGERLLIVEEEFLIALDIQRVLEGANAETTVFARNFKEAAALEGRFGEFDLAIVTAPRPGTGDQKVAELLAKSGPGMVICSAANIVTTGTPLEGAETVYKPFSDDQLLAACRRALDKRKSR
jgi:two-component system, response regulator PdtaR